MKLKWGEVSWLPRNNANLAATRLRTQGWRVVMLPDGLRNGQEFLSAIVRAQIPRDPPMTHFRVWDALLDALRGGVQDLHETRLAFVWLDPSAMRESAPVDYEKVMMILADLAEHAPLWSANRAPLDLRVIVAQT